VKISFRQLWPTSLEGKPSNCRKISMALSSFYTFWPVHNFVRLQWSWHLSWEIFESELGLTLSETRGEITKTIDFALFGLTMSKIIGADWKSNTFPILLVELGTCLGHRLTCLMLPAVNLLDCQSETSLEFSRVPKLSTPHSPPFCSQL